MGAVIGSLWGGVIANHRRRLNFVASCALAGGATALILFAIEPAIWVTVFIAFGAVCVLSIGYPVFITFATDVSGQSRATAVGMMGGSSGLGGVLGSSLGGAFLAIGGFNAVGIFCLVTMVISALIIQLFMREPTGVN